MARVSHTSSNVDWTDYDEKGQKLTVRYHSGKTYTYDRVPAHKYENLMNAESVGQHLNVHIIPNHPARKH
jgi:hypothetical protein